jgi:hypothetical protein
MRLKTEIVQARETFVREKYTAGWALEQIQDALVHEGPGGLKGVKMALPRLQELKGEAKSKPVAKPKDKGPYIQAVCELGECTNAFTRPQKEWGQLPVCPTCVSNNRKRKVA